MSNQLVQLLFMEESIATLIFKKLASSSGREISVLECSDSICLRDLPYRASRIT